MDKARIGNALKNYIGRHRVRIVVAVLLLAVELYFFFGTGALLEEETHFVTGEGSWDIALSSESGTICQEFVPTHGFLHSLSFCMDMSPVADLDGTVVVSVLDEKEQVIFEKSMGYADITDGAFTDVEVDLRLARGKNYYLVLSCAASDETGYPVIRACSKEYALEESGRLIYNEEIDGQHLVSRYQYEDAMTASRACKAVFLCLAAFAGVLIVLPDNRYVRWGLGAAVLLAAPYVLGQRLELLNLHSVFYLPFAMKWNIGIIYALELVVLLFTHSAGISVTLTNTAVTALYTADYFMRLYRGTPLRMNDFSAAGTAAKVVGEYDLTPNSHLAMIWGMLIVFAVFALQTRKPRQKEKRDIKRCVLSYGITGLLAAALTLCGGYQLLYTDWYDRVGFMEKDLVGFEYDLMYFYNGYLVSTCIDIQRSRIVKPEGYSAEEAARVLTEYAQEEEAVAAEELPHVILVMNESLSDVRVLGDVELSQDNLTFINSLQENTIKGWANASTFGGGTANSEFEVFTGCSMAFLPSNYYPYQQAMIRPVNSMVSQMKKYGYSTVAMHPESPMNWNRKNVYDYLGFDKMLFREDFEGAEVIHSGVSDEETYRRIIELYEERAAGEKLFVFDLTMQNHGGYKNDESPYEVTALNLQEPQLDEYLSLIKISDEAFAELVGYFEQQDEKVIICMFGDHQPWIFDEVIAAGLAHGDSALEQTMNKYRTPFVIWANYDIEEAEGCDISMNYLGGLLMRTAGIPRSPYFRFLEQLSGDYPIVTINGYVDSEGVCHAWKDDAAKFSEYRMLQYNYLFDTDTVEWGY